jgi:hypothetical protein
MTFQWIDNSFEASKIEKYRLDIQVGLYDLRFCVSKIKSDKILGFAVLEHDFNSEFDSKVFLELTKTLEFPFSKKYGEVTWVVSSTNFSLVPAHLVDKTQVKTILGMNSDAQKTILTEEVAEKEISIITGVHVAQLEFVKKHFPGIKVKHLSSILFRIFRTLVDQRKAALLYVQGDMVFLGVFNEGEILFLNGYEIKGTEDLLYYLGGIVQTNDIDREKDALLVLGDVQKNGPEIELLKRYFKDIAFPIPYLISQDASIPHKQPNHYFSALFNQRVCV